VSSRLSTLPSGRIVLAIAIGTLSASRDAHATGPVGFELATTVGEATNPRSGVPNALGFESGVRAGVKLFNFYGGLSFTYSFGGAPDESCAGPVIVACTTSPIGVSVHSLRYGAEAGYDIYVFNRLAMRPWFGVGSLSFYQSSPVQIVVGGALQGLDGMAKDLYLQPGVSLILSLGHLLLGADGGMLFVPGLHDSNPAFTVSAQAGVRF
jgi:hypothetical protein